MRTLGLSVGAASVHGVLLEHRTIAWAGSASYGSLAELTETIARLAGESGHPVQAVRVVLGREVVQLRTLLPAPPLKPAAMRRYVALEAARLFRKNGSALVADAVTVDTGEQGTALFAAAASQPVLEAIFAGCTQAGLRVEALAPAADVLTASVAAASVCGEIVFPNGGTTEVLSVVPKGVWRSRLQSGTNGKPDLQWAEPLCALGDDASHFAGAYAAAVQLPRLELWPPDTRRVRARDSRRGLIHLASVGFALWAIAGGVYVGRQLSMLHSSKQYLNTVASQLDSALALRRDLDAGRATLATIATARAARSRLLELVAQIATVLPDSVVIVSITVGSDSEVRLAGLAPSAAGVEARIERVTELRDVKVEGPITRETVVGGRLLDRFAIIARLRGGQ